MSAHAYFESRLDQKLSRRTKEDLLRRLGGHSPQLIDFFSNDYLGFSRSEELHAAIRVKVDQLPHRNGSTGSRLLSGNDPYTEEVEEKLADFFKADSCLIFNSGYSANLAVLSSIPQRSDTLLYDELVHASIKDGARLSLATRLPFRHNDLGDLERKLQKANGSKYVVIESVYSMDGDSPDLKAMAELVEKYEAAMIIDEAHGTGVVGEHGSGLIIKERLEHRVPVRIYTFGKAMGVHGACVCGSKTLVDYLINFARPFIYTTSLPPHSIASIDCALDHLIQGSTAIASMFQNVQYFLQAAKESEIRDCTSNYTPIQTILIPGNESVKHCAKFLQNAGLDIRPILSPTVKPGSERLRVCLHSFNTHDEINLMVNSLAELPIV